MQDRRGPTGSAIIAGSGAPKWPHGVKCPDVDATTRMALLEQIFVAFDTETTGLSPVTDRVVEIAGIAFKADGSEIAAFEQLVDPQIPIPPALTQIHGITDSMVAGKPAIDDVLPAFVSFVESFVLVAHNAPYDVAMLAMPALRLARRAGPRAGPAGNIVLDTCALARTVLPGSPSYRLRTLAARLGIPEARPHRAMSDVATCKELFLRILHTCGPGIDLDGLIRLNRTELYLGPPREEVFQRLCAGAGPRLSSLRDAVLTGVPIAIRYRGGTKGDAPRLVTPITVMVQANHAYLVAQCHLDQGLKNFRLDLISAVQSAPA